MSKTRASCFIRGAKHLETIKPLGLVLSSVSRCLEPLMKHSHSFLTYYLRMCSISVVGVYSMITIPAVFVFQALW